MRKLDYNEFKLCQMLGILFEQSLAMSHLSSPMFIKRFMNAEEAACFFDKSYLAMSMDTVDVISRLDSKYGETRNRILYSKDQMYWIGYAYGAISFLYELPPKTVFSLFPSKEIIKYHKIYHTFGMEEAVSRMMENIGYVEKDYLHEGVQILRHLMHYDELKKLIGENVLVEGIDENHMGMVHGYSERNEDIKTMVLEDNLEGCTYNGKVIGIEETKDDGFLLLAGDDTLCLNRDKLRNLRRKLKKQENK